MRLLVGDDWAQDHHDIEVMDEGGEGAGPQADAAGVARMGQQHELISRFLPEQARTQRFRSGSRPAAARGWRR